MLRDFVQTALTAAELGDLLTMAGFELEGIEGTADRPVLDIKVMSNRGDGLSVLGLAREILAKDGASQPTELYNRAVHRFADVTTGDLPTHLVIRRESAHCDKFGGVEISGIRNGASPEWLATRLTEAGMRPINLVVDLSNYVMLEVGQPLHAYDASELGSEIIVRFAHAGEEFHALNGEKYELDDEAVVIANPAGPVGIAGVMGGDASESRLDTTRIILEAAHFLNTSVRRTRKALNLSTEASYRFERSVDPQGVETGLRRFVDLLRSLQPEVQVSDLVVDFTPPPARQPIEVRVDRAAKLLGFPIPDREAAGYLQRLGFDLSGHGNPYVVLAPTWRPDIVREEDVIEEIGRVHGYERIPEALPQGTTAIGGSHGAEWVRDQLLDAAIRLGYVQIVSHSLRDTHPLDALGGRVGPRTPGSPDLAYLRNSLWPSLADAAIRNGALDLSLVELGRVFSPEAEATHLALLTTGNLLPVERSDDASPTADFYRLKGDVEAILASVQRGARFRTGNDPRLHPTRQADVVLGGAVIGSFGQIHPRVAKATDLPAATFLAELDLAGVVSGPSDFAWQSVRRTPSIRRDIAIAIDRTVPYEALAQIVAERAGDVLERQWLFDVYQGKGIEPGQQSLGIALVLRKVEGTFTDEEANQVRDEVVAGLTAVGAKLR